MPVSRDPTVYEITVRASKNAAAGKPEPANTLPADAPPVNTAGRDVEGL